MTESALISKVWNFANVLRDDGVGYGDYLEQITYLLFLKMADEMSKPPYSKNIQFPRIKDTEGREIPNGEFCNWETLSMKRGAELEAYYSQCFAHWVRRKEFWDRSSLSPKTKSKTLPSYSG